jgi:hypothetical protein
MVATLGDKRNVSRTAGRVIPQSEKLIAKFIEYRVQFGTKSVVDGFDVANLKGGGDADFDLCSRLQSYV